eukprot:Skav206082  [mRNA]  locus=scaffold2150:33552:38108:+ [translate_table: standard]
MSPRGLPDAAMDLLEEFRFHWSPTMLHKRCTLMIECDYDNDESKEMTVKIWSPEGLDLQQFWDDVMTIPGDRPMGISGKLIWNRNDGKPPKNQKLWLFKVLYTRNDSEEFFSMDEQSSWAPVPEKKDINELTAIELFAGGFAGWTTAWKVLSPLMNQDLNVLAVDSDERACKTYAITHGATYIPSNQEVQPQDFAEKSNRIIWNANIHEEHMTATLTKMQPQIVTVSAPCPPWSGAAGAEGLESDEGALLMKALLMCRAARPKVIAVEQVSNFNSHPHKSTILRTVQFMGYRLQGQRVLNMDRHSNTSRCRWLAIFTRVADSTLQPLISWPTGQETQTNPVMQLKDEDLHQLTIDDKARQVASNPAMLKGGRVRTPTQVFAERLYKEGDTIPCFMAQYNNQHNLPTRLLEKYGYYGHFLATNEAKTEGRYWHPAEIALMHGVQSQYWVDADLPTSYRLVGNCIGTPHAMFLIINALQHVNCTIDMKTAFDLYHETKLKPNQCELLNTTVGQMLKHEQTTIDQQTIANYVNLYQSDDRQDQWWNPKEGWTNQRNQTQIDDSMEAQDETMHDMPATSPMFAHFQAFLCFGSTRQMFWYSAELQAAEIETHWQGAYWSIPGQGNTHEIMLSEQPYGPDDLIFPTQSVPIFTEHDATIVKLQTDQCIMNQPQIAQFGQLYDQYGIVGVRQTMSPIDVLTTKPWEYNRPKEKIVSITKAMMETQTFWSWDSHEDKIVAKIVGPREPTDKVLQFWGNLLSENTLNLLGRAVQIVGNQVHFRSDSTRIACPSRPFIIGIAIQATKALFSICTFSNTTTKCYIEMRLFGRPLWTGDLPENLSIDVIKTILKLAMRAYTKHLDFRIIATGKQIYDYTLGELNKKGDTKIILHAVGSQRGGGGNDGGKGAKRQTKMNLQSALATTLLEHGHPLEWTKQTVDHLVWKYGIPKLQTIADQPRGPTKIQHIMELCKEQGIQPAELPKPSSQRQQTGMPWNSNKKRKDINHNIDPRDFQIVADFFYNHDDTPIDIIQNIKPQTSGLCLLTAKQAQQWITSDQLLSSDELVIVALGPVKPHESLKATPVTFPAINPDKQQVLLHGTMIQLGAKHAKHRQGNPTQVAVENCVVMSITMNKEDWSAADWQTITHNPAAMIRETLKEDNLSHAIQSLWGKSLRNGKAPCSPLQAQSCQMHCTVSEAHEKTMLAKSGFNRLYCVPKTPQGKVQQQYRIIWCDGDLPQVTGHASKTPHALGLIRNRNQGFGIRVDKTNFAEAWTSIFPGVPQPELREGEFTYKVENLQFGTTKTMIDNWLAQLKWKAVAFKSLGPQSWIIKTNEVPPEGIHLFNTAPVLIRRLQDKLPRQERVLLGPMPKHTGPRQDPWQVSGSVAEGDPWARWTTTQAPATASAPSMTGGPPRAASGPIETKFQEQQAKINQLEQSMQALTQTQKDQHAQLQQQVATVEKAQEKQSIQVHSALKNMQSEIDKNINRTLQKHAQNTDAQFQELKRLFLANNKRDKPELAAEDMDQSGS